MSHKVPAKAFAVLYTWNNAPGKAIFLTKDKALDYIVRLKLSDAKLKPMYFEDDFEGLEGCIVKASDVVLESVEKDGKLECVSASNVLTVMPGA